MPTKTRSWIPFLDALAIGLWGVTLWKLWLTQEIALLLHPNYIPLVVVAGPILVGMGGWQFYQHWRKPPLRTGHQNALAPGWSSTLLLVSAVLGLIVTPRPFTSQIAIDRGVADFSSLRPAAFRTKARPEDRTLLDWVRTLDVYPEPEAYRGQKARIEGFVVRSPDLPPGYFRLVRFVITCCAADVYPVSLPIRYEGDSQDYPNDRWLRVEGTATVTEIQGKRQLAIAAQTLVPIPPPRNPYET